MACNITDGRRYSRTLCPDGPGKAPKAAEQPKQKQIVEPFKESTFGWARRNALELLGQAGIFQRL